MDDGPIGSTTRRTLSRVATRLQAARREALEEVSVPTDEREWEYAGRTWSWPAGEAMTYFRGLAPNERTVLDRATDEHGGEVVGIGTGRVVIGLPDDVGGEPLVAKLARYGPSAEMGAGRPQNRRERRLWETVEEHPFLPVRDGDDDGNWIVMPEANVFPADTVGGSDDTERDDAERDDALDRVREALASHRDRFHFDELKSENVGAYDGRYWIVDYGRPKSDALFVDPPRPKSSE